MGAVAQQKWISKLLGYDFTISYKKAKENVIVDALSWKMEEENLIDGSLAMISFPNPEWVAELKESYEGSAEMKEIREKLRRDRPAPKGNRENQGFLLKKGMIVIVPNSLFKNKVMHYIHNHPFGGHSGYLKTYQRAKWDFYWQWMKKDIKKLVWECDTCQAVKYQTSPPAGLLQPLPIPQQAWTDIFMDFESSYVSWSKCYSCGY